MRNVLAALLILSISVGCIADDGDDSSLQGSLDGFEMKRHIYSLADDIDVSYDVSILKKNGSKAFLDKNSGFRTGMISSDEKKMIFLEIGSYGNSETYVYHEDDNLRCAYLPGKNTSSCDYAADCPDDMKIMGLPMFYDNITYRNILHTGSGIGCENYVLYFNMSGYIEHKDMLSDILGVAGNDMFSLSICIDDEGIPVTADLFPGKGTSSTAVAHWQRNLHEKDIKRDISGYDFVHHTGLVVLDVACNEKEIGIVVKALDDFDGTISVDGTISKKSMGWDTLLDIRSGEKKVIGLPAGQAGSADRSLNLSICWEGNCVHRYCSFSPGDRDDLGCLRRSAGKDICEMDAGCVYDGSSCILRDCRDVYDKLSCDAIPGCAWDGACAADKCTDHDAGLNSIEIASYSEDKKDIFEDRCKDADTLLEAVCSGSAAGQEEIGCSCGCSDGMCRHIPEVRHNFNKIAGKYYKDTHETDWIISGTVSAVEDDILLKSVRYWISNDLDPNNAAGISKYIDLGIIIKKGGSYDVPDWAFRYGGEDQGNSPPIVWMKPEWCGVD